MEQRTIRQNNSLHKWCREMADKLNETGLDLRIVLSKDKLETQWNEFLFKEIIIRQFATALYKKSKTSELTTKELSHLVDAITEAFNREFGVFVEFPSIESLKD